MGCWWRAGSVEGKGLGSEDGHAHHGTGSCAYESLVPNPVADPLGTGVVVGGVGAHMALGTGEIEGQRERAEMVQRGSRLLRWGKDQGILDSVGSSELGLGPR